MKLSIYFGLKTGLFGLIFSWVLQLIKIEITAAEVTLMLTWFQIGVLGVCGFLGVLAGIEWIITMRKDHRDDKDHRKKQGK